MLIGLTLLLAVGWAASAASASSGRASTNPDQADGPGIITIEQLNMCMWGSRETEDCFPNDGEPNWTEAERETAAQKRAAMIEEITDHIPDLVTVSEGCLDDLREVADAIGYELAYQDTGGGTDDVPRACTVDRGIGVNAILAKDITGTGPQGYFEDPGWRSYLCAQVSTDEWDSVRVCTAHLSLKSQGDRQAIECAMLRDEILDPSPGYTLFAGDVNMSGANENCAPDRFHGLKNLERTADDQAENPRDGLQHIYYSAGFWRQSCAWSYSVEHTDHEGFLLELGTSPPDEYGRCWRNVFE